MRSKSKVNKKSSRITEIRGIKSGIGKKKTKVKQNITNNKNRANRRKVTRTRRPKTLKTIRQKPQRRKTTLKKEIVVKDPAEESKNLIRIDWHKRLADQVYLF